jgi:hypothetical protein
LGISRGYIYYCIEAVFHIRCAKDFATPSRSS